MNRALFVVAMAGLTVVACADGSFPYQCSNDSDCQAGSSCQQRLCILQGDAGVADAGPDAGIGDAGSADAGDADAAVLDAGASDGSLPLPDSGMDGGASDGGSNGCLISQAAYKSGDLDPANPCESCQPTVSATSWTAVPNGTTCGGGLVCISGGCSASCWIDSAQYPSGSTKFGNPCLVCQPNSSTTSWSNVAEGISCGMGKYCHTGSCLDGCWIGSAFYASGAARPGYPCQSCQPATTPTAWSNLVDNTNCSVINATCLCLGGAGFVTLTPSVTASTLYGVWGSGPRDVWAVGQSGTALRWTGSAWVSYPTNTTADLHSVWGTSATDVWAVGANGVTLRWKGASWSTQASGTTETLNSVHGSGAADVWAVGTQGTILHWTGGAWSSMPKGSPLTNIGGVWASSTTDAWAVGAASFRWNGTEWLNTGTWFPYPRSVCGNSATDIWENTGTQYSSFLARHWNGNQLEPTGTSILDDSLRLGNGLWCNRDDDVWAVVGTTDLDGLVFHWNGSTWVGFPSSSSYRTLNSIWGTSEDIWVVGSQGTILRAKR